MGRFSHFFSRLDAVDKFLILYWLVTAIFCPYVWQVAERGMNYPIAFAMCLFLFALLNYMLSSALKECRKLIVGINWPSIKKYNSDLLLKFFSFFLKNIKIIFNFIKIKILLFFRFLKNRFKNLIVNIRIAYNLIKFKAHQ